MAEKYRDAADTKKKETISHQQTTFMFPSVVCALLLLDFLSKSSFRNPAGRSCKIKKKTGYEEKTNFLGSNVMKSGCW